MRKPCPIAILFTINLTWTDLGSNTGLHAKRPITDRCRTIPYLHQAVLIRNLQTTQQNIINKSHAIENSNEGPANSTTDGRHCVRSHCGAFRHGLARGSSVTVVTRLLAETVFRYLALLHSAHTGSGPIQSLFNGEGSFPRGRTAGA